jgi:phosphatidyl-myo-inositol alpha-mannosyltransferase
VRAHLPCSAPRTPGSSTAPPLVVFVCLASGMGGSTRSLATVLDHLGGRATRVLATPISGGFASLAVERGLTEAVIPIPGARAGAARGRRLYAAAAISHWIWRHRRAITALHANGPEELNLLAPIARATNIRLVVWSHARAVSPWMRRLGPIWGHILKNAEVRWAAVSNLARRVIVEGGLAIPERVDIVPNPIDPADVLASGRSWQSDRVRIGYLGSDARYKGFQLLPDMIDALRDAPVQWLLFTTPRSADNSGSWNRLRSMPPDLVRISPKMDDVRDAYARCDVVVLPSLEESFGRVAAEAMINGLPVVASDLEPVRELLGDDDAGVLFAPGNIDEAGAAIRRLVSDADLRRQMGLRGVARARSFDPARIVEVLGCHYGIDMSNVTPR